MLHSFTTRAANRLERSRQWCALTRAQNVQFDDDREASLRGGEFGDVRLCVVSMGRHRVEQSAPGEQATLRPALKFLFQEEGAARVRQHYATQELAPGQWCVLRKDLPFMIEAPAQSRQLAITLPADLLTAGQGGIPASGHPHTFMHGPAQILHASAAASVMTGNSLSQDDRRVLGVQIAQLAEMTMRIIRAGYSGDLRERRRIAILEYVDQHLADEKLSVATIADAFGMSPRSVHKLFEGEPNTIARTIWDRRLERCRDMIVDPAASAQSITEIAHFWGFADSQHFSRAFKLRFGMAPRDYRSLFALH